MSAWPLVHERDDGIRPAGRPDECFYCHRKVGQEHKRQCGIIDKRVEMRVTAKLPDGRTLRGAGSSTSPTGGCRTIRSSTRTTLAGAAETFFGSGIRGSVTWQAGDPWDALEAIYESDGGSCLCNGELYFEFVRVIDATPRWKIREAVPGRSN